MPQVEQNTMDREQYSQAVVARRVAEEIERQDRMFGPFDSTAGSVRLAVACLEDEVREIRDEWQKWKKRPDWYSVRAEAIQLAAVAARLARDVEVEAMD